jgi:hypothetical protein
MPVRVTLEARLGSSADTATGRTAVKRGALVALLGLIVIGFPSGSPVSAAGSLRAYYLFLAGAPQGCEDCYVPLLVAEQPLPEVAASGRDITIILITTYERDSVWKVERGVSLAARDVSPDERVVRLQGRRYRYQEIPPGEVLRLMENPEGRVPIHRAAPVPDRKSLEDLVVAFRELHRQPAAAGPHSGSPGRTSDLRSTEDLRWLIDHDRRTLGAEYRAILDALAAGKVPTAEDARAIALRFKLTHGGLLAEEGASVVSLLRIGRDLPPLARQGDLVWVVRISHFWLGVTQEVWIGSASGEVRSMPPPDAR